MILAAPAEFRTFTSSDGTKTIEAKVTAANSTDVTIQMKSGQVVTSAITKFSEADREFIAKWRETAPPAARVWTFACNPQKIRTGKKESATRTHNVTEESWAYDLNLENRSAEPAIDIEIRYRIFVKSEHEEGRNGKAYYFAEAVLPVPRIEARGRQNLRTRDVPVLISNLKPEFYHEDGTRKRRTDELAGVWLKAFSKEGDFLWEYKTPGKATTDHLFTNEEALEIGKDAPKE